MELAVIADELTALGWRLAGARVYTPEPSAARDCLLAAGRSADLILMTASLADHVPPAQLEQALQASGPPLLLVMPDLLHAREPVDIALEAHRALGIVP